MTSFWVLRAPKSWSKPFFSCFSTFFVHFKAFSVISRLKSLKNVWTWTKNYSYSKLVDMQKLVNSLRGYLEIVFFRLIFYFFNVFQHFSTDFGVFYNFFKWKLMISDFIFKDKKDQFMQKITKSNNIFLKNVFDVF